MWRRSRKRATDDFSAEVRAHLELETQRLIEGGMSPEEAQTVAKRRFGNVGTAEESFYESRRLSIRLDHFLQDVRYALRMLVRRRHVTAIALLSLAFGIGANTLVFTVVNTLMFRPLPYPDPERLVRLSGLTRGNCASIRDTIELFEYFGCYTDGVGASIADSSQGTAERVNGLRLTAGAAQSLGIKPVLGRWFTEDEGREGAGSVLLISSSLWQKRFLGCHDVLGKIIRFDGGPATIIGVMPEQFEFVAVNSDFWLPIRTSAEESQTAAPNLAGIGRLKPAVHLSAAEAAIHVVSVQTPHSPLELDRRPPIRVTRLQRSDVDVLADAGDSLLVLQGAVAFVLMIACANVAGLLLAEGTTQHREMAVRTALGSGRWRVFRQLIVHAALLSGFGGILGFILGWWGVRLLRTSLPAGLPHAIYAMHLDMRVLAMTVTICVLCTLLVGLAPALQISHVRPLDAMRGSDRGTTPGGSRQRLRGVFVSGQIALAFVLLVGAGLMINSLARLSNVPLGFDPANLVTVRIELPDGKFRRATRAVLPTGALEMLIDPEMFRMAEDLRAKLAAVPGIATASGIAIYPPLSGAMNMPIRAEDDKAAEPQRAQFLPILPDYFKTLKVAVVAGREFTRADAAGGLPVVVINRALANQYWPQGSPLGKHLRLDTPFFANNEPREIVGVVDDVMQYVGQESRPQMYLPYAQLPPGHDERLSNELRALTFVVRTTLPLQQVIPSVRGAVAEIDNSQAISGIQSMHDTAFQSLQRRKIYVGLLGSFAAVAVLLALIGVYGVMAQVVGQRTNEIGIRMALGADRARVRSLILRYGAWLVGGGMVAGIIGAFALTRLIRNALYGVASTDPLTFAGGAVLLGVVALIACYLPARRASRIDPMVALRHD